MNERLAGFADAEGLVLAMLDNMAEKERAKTAEARERAVQAKSYGEGQAWNGAANRHWARMQFLSEVEAALRMGQHRAAEYGDPDLARRLERAHQRMANGTDKGRRGGEKSSAGMTKAERVRKAKLAAEARWGKRRSTTAKDTGEAT